MRPLTTAGDLLSNVFRKGFFHLLSANLVVNLLAFGSQIIVVRFLSAVELGQVKTLQAFVSVAVIISAFGFNTAVLKLCSEKRPLAERALIYRLNLGYSLVPVAAVVGSLLAAARLGLLSPDPAVNRWMPVYMWTVPALTYISLALAYQKALKRIKALAGMQLGIGLLGFVALIGATALYGLDGYIISKVVVGYVLLLGVFFIVRARAGGVNPEGNIFRNSFFYAKWSVAGNGVAALGLYADIFLLNTLIRDRAQFGYYSLATIFITGLYQLNNTVQSIATPYFSEKSADRRDFARVLKKYQVLMVGLVAGVSAVLFFAVPVFIRHMYGDEYGPAGLYFRILLLKYFFRSCYALPGVAIIGLGKMKYNFAAVAISVPFTFVISYLFIIRAGLIGAAWAQAISYLFTAVLMAFILKRVLKIHFASDETGGWRSPSTPDLET